MIGAGYMSSSQIRDQIREIKRLTKKNFGINLFIPSEFNVSESAILKANQLLQPIKEQLNLKNISYELPIVKNEWETFHEQLRVVIEEGVPVCSFTFGVPSKEVIKELKKHQITLIGTATTAREAKIIEDVGMDIIVVQGSEAGGHRGTFVGNPQDSSIGLISLIPQVVAEVNIPILAAGGIMDGKGLRASICLGASGVQMGTAFLTCLESGAHNAHKQAILKSKGDQTVLTRVYSGKWARGIKNKFYSHLQEHEVTLPDFPIQNTLTSTIRKAASMQNNPEYMSLWAGQSASLAKNLSVEELMNQIIAEAKEVEKNL
jgi:nitronate monooxygenase